ncbi:FxsA family protein [Candidatus Hydrogenedentota bacterium]
MFFRLFLLFVLTSTVEFVLLVWIANEVGFMGMVAIVIVTGVAGAHLARREGAKAFHEVRTSVARGEMPGNALLNALLVLIAGVLLITPGILTDIAGFVLLVPYTRDRIRRKVIHRIHRSIQHGNIHMTYRR